MLLRSRRRIAATTLIESTVASAIGALFLSTLFSINTAAMQTVKMGREVAAASQVLQQRMESLRIANWQQVTNATWVRDNLLNTDVSGSAAIKGLSEQLTLIPYGSATVGNTQLSRANGSSSIVSTNQALQSENAIKVIWTIAYSGSPNNRSVTRQLVTILAKGGVAKW